MMSMEERLKVMSENPPKIDSVHHGYAYFDWAWKGCGFGQLDFRVNRKEGTIHIANECMSRERVREILVAFANHIADVGILDDEPFNQGKTE